MISPAQHDILESFFGVNGDLFNVIQDHVSFDLGTKILYLERAISEDCTIFLNSLDKLYIPHLTGQEKAANLDFIRTLKRINDLCFNNTVSRGIYGSEEALYFLRKLTVGGDFNPLEYQTRIQEMINQRISEINNTEADVQKAQRITHENHVLRQTQWRDELDLPRAQRAMVVSSGALTVTQYQELDDTIKQLIDSNPLFTLQLIQEFNLTLNDIITLPIQELNQMYAMSALSKYLINVGHISLAILQASDPLIRIKVLSNSEAIYHLVTNGIQFTDIISLEPEILSEVLRNSIRILCLVQLNIPIADLMSLKFDILNEVLRNLGAIDILVNRSNIPFSDLVSLNLDILKVLLGSASAIEVLVNRLNILFTDLVSLRLEIISEILRYIDNFTILVTHHHIPFNDLVSLQPVILNEVLRHQVVFGTLVSFFNIPFNDLVSLQPDILNEVLRNHDKYGCLVKLCNIPLTELISLRPEIQSEVFENMTTIQFFVCDLNIPFKKLSNLKLEELQKVLTKPDSEETQDILSSPTSGYSP